MKKKKHAKNKAERLPDKFYKINKSHVNCNKKIVEKAVTIMTHLVTGINSQKPSLNSTPHYYST